jgi:hypothetical protein
MIAWKVVRTVLHRPYFRSAWMVGAARLIYRPGEATNPLPDTGIIAFRTRHAATAWVERMKYGSGSKNLPLRILRGHGKKMKLPAIAHQGTFYKLSRRAARSVWQPKPEKGNHPDPWPPGTVALTSFTPDPLVQQG